MEFGQLFYVLRTRWWLLVATTLLVLVAAVAYRIAFPASYRAVASVVVDPRGINPVSGAATQESMAQDSVLGTYANVARSEGVARQVFLHLPESLRDLLKSQWLRAHAADEPGFEAWAARKIQKDVDIRAGGQSSHVLDITFSNRDRVEAAEVANAYAATLIQYSREMRIASARKDADYFKVQAQTLRNQTEEAEQRLAAFQRKNGITSLDDRTDIETARLAALNSQALVNQDLSYDSSSRARQAAGPNGSTDVISNTVVQTLNADLAEKEAKLRQLSARLGANHPDMITARAQVDQARDALARESKNVAASLASSSMAAQSRAASLRIDSERQRQKVVELNSLRVELSSLDKDVGQKRKLYEAALQRSTETGLEAGSQREDLMLLTEAFPPDDRSGPGASVVLPVALLAGLLIGVLIAIGLDRLRPRLHRLVDFEEMGIPVLQVVPVVRLTASPFSPKYLSIR
ncbi:MAG: hypothetical protein JWQ73_641 [Variovorax sp.]|nr:hypothetical protein [Variovorax sp.]